MSTSSEETTINLSNDITVNGVRYKAGQGVRVPKNQAEDISRMDHEHNQYLRDLNRKHTYQVDGGTIAAGGGAE